MISSGLVPFDSRSSSAAENRVQIGRPWPDSTRSYDTRPKRCCRTAQDLHLFIVSRRQPDVSPSVANTTVTRVELERADAEASAWPHYYDRSTRGRPLVQSPPRLRRDHRGSASGSAPTDGLEVIYSEQLLEPEFSRTWSIEKSQAQLVMLTLATAHDSSLTQAPRIAAVSEIWRQVGLSDPR